MTERFFALDRILSKIIQSRGFSSFTITQLRSEYMRLIPGSSSPSATRVRRYLYKQVGRLVRVGWITRNGKPMSRDIAYCVQVMPTGISINLTESPFGQEALVEQDNGTLSTDRTSPPSPKVSPFHDIEAKLNKVRVDFMATVGEAEAYRTILAEHPCLRKKLEDTYHIARNRSSNLMGQLRALEQTVKILEEQQ